MDKKFIFLTMVLSNIPIVSFLFFSFMFPNISFPPIGDYLLNYAILFLVIPIFIGIINSIYFDNISDGIKVSIISLFSGYIFSFLYYSWPFFYGFVPLDYSAYYFTYIKFTIIPFFGMFIGYVIGSFFGGFFQDYMYARYGKKNL